MINNNLKFIPRDTRNHSKESIAERRYHRIKGKSLKKILVDRFLNHYGFDKGIVTANAIVDDILITVDSYYRYSDNSLLNQDRWSGTLCLLMNFLLKVNQFIRLLLNLLSLTLSPTAILRI